MSSDALVTIEMAGASWPEVPVSVKLPGTAPSAVSRVNQSRSLVPPAKVWTESKWKGRPQSSTASSPNSMKYGSQMSGLPEPVLVYVTWRRVTPVELRSIRSMSHWM